jgi:hypothetical protein
MNNYLGLMAKSYAPMRISTRSDRQLDLVYISASPKQDAQASAL